MNANTSETTWSDGLAERTAGTRQLWQQRLLFLISRQPAHSIFISIFLLPMRGVVHSSALALWTPDLMDNWKLHRFEEDAHKLMTT